MWKVEASRGLGPENGVRSSRFWGCFQAEGLGVLGHGLADGRAQNIAQLALGVAMFEVSEASIVVYFKVGDRSEIS